MTFTSVGINGPVTILQNVPPEPPTLVSLSQLRTNPKSAVLDVIIDEQGDVERVDLKGSIQPVCDRVVLEAAERWKYNRPRGGVPVKFEKVIGLASIRPEE